MNCVVFFPELCLQKHPSLLYGLVLSIDNGIAVYILGVSCSSKCKYVSNSYEILGEITYADEPDENVKSKFWIMVQLSPVDGVIERVCVNSKMRLHNVTVILYNNDFINKSQLLTSTFDIHQERNDYIFHLICSVQKQPKVCCKKRFKLQHAEFLKLFLLKLCYIIQPLSNSMKSDWLKPLIKVSSFWSHSVNILETYTDLINLVLKDEHLNIPFFNYVFARICDALFGQLIIYFVLCHLTSSELFVALTQFQEVVVVHLKDTVEWLMGSPAGLKLYCPLNNIYGSFCQFHISLWWTFLKLFSPILKITFGFFLFLGNFGFSFQVSILADLLAIVSVHMYCIYVYAARLYYFQMKGLRILSRLFIGKQRSPLPGSLHSPPYTTEQLLFGTVSFTILLFLLPTTLIYYTVFTGIRVILIFIGGFLTRSKYIMNVFPIYLAFIWFYNPIALTCAMRLSMKTHYLSDGTLVTQVKPICESWWKTVDICIPRTVRKPDKIEWRKLTADVLRGNLIYTV